MNEAEKRPVLSGQALGQDEMIKGKEGTSKQEYMYNRTAPSHFFLLPFFAPPFFATNPFTLAKPYEGRP